MSKKSAAAPPAFVPPQDNSKQFQSTLDSYKAQTDQQMELTKTMFAEQLAAMKADVGSATANLPPVVTTEVINSEWEKKAEDLKKESDDRAAATKVIEENKYKEDQAKKKTRSSTILTSELLDSADPKTSTSILTGS